MASATYCDGKILALFPLLLMAAWFCLAAAAHADAPAFKTLLMPGKLAAGHAKFENDCGQCHVSFAKEAQDRLCAECHRQVAADIEKNTGMHGRLPRGDALQCKHCHTDHKGREADIVGLDRDTFNHAATDFALQGAHRDLPCGSCHAAGKKMREAPGDCHACHQRDDRHRGALGPRCENCHSAAGWAQPHFDHNSTRFPLRGGHQQATCSACHPGERYKATPATCNACHALNDVHRGANGIECKRCHDESRWTKVAFDHNRDTHFALRGAHAATACNSCHRGGTAGPKPGSACIDCHRADDAHKGRNGSRCDSCHTEATWKKQIFDHARDARFALRGGHARLSCETCHRGGTQQKLPQDCFGCHRSDDPHRGQQGQQCERCHNENGWTGGVAFDHNRSRFPLRGLHAVAPCEACHVSAEFKGTATQCYACHQRDDKHRRTLGVACETCHDPSAWSRAKFDHGQTRFALTGAHAALACADCHRAAADSPRLPRDCFSCHAADDEHDGRFGRACERCHNTRKFSEIEMLR